MIRPPKRRGVGYTRRASTKRNNGKVARRMATDSRYEMNRELAKWGGVDLDWAQEDELVEQKPKDHSNTSVLSDGS